MRGGMRAAGRIVGAQAAAVEPRATRVGPCAATAATRCHCHSCRRARG